MSAQERKPPSPQVVAPAAANPLPAPLAQSLPVAVPASYPLPLEDRDRVRDMQHADDQLEIANQKMLLQIEQNKKRQAEVKDGEQRILLEFAQKKNIDLSLYEFEPVLLQFQKKPAMQQQNQGTKP
jgi:hypothetical protein